MTGNFMIKTGELFAPKWWEIKQIEAKHNTKLRWLRGRGGVQLKAPGCWRRRRSHRLTEEVVPLRVQVRLVGQAASHHVQAVVLAGLQRHLARAVRTVQHLGGGSHAAGGRTDLEEAESG